jgi:hypothetical protein
MPKKITQINPPNNRPHKIPSNQPFTGITWIAVNTAMPILVKMMIMVPLRMEIQGSTGKDVFDLDCLSACDFFLFATICSGGNLMLTLRTNYT